MDPYLLYNLFDLFNLSELLVDGVDHTVAGRIFQYIQYILVFGERLEISFWPPFGYGGSTDP